MFGGHEIALYLREHSLIWSSYFGRSRFMSIDHSICTQTWCKKKRCSVILVLGHVLGRLDARTMVLGQQQRFQCSDFGVRTTTWGLRCSNTCSTTSMLGQWCSGNCSNFDAWTRDSPASVLGQWCSSNCSNFATWTLVPRQLLSCFGARTCA